MQKMTILILCCAVFVSSACAGGERARRPKVTGCTNPAPSDADVRQLRDYLADARRSLPELPTLDREHMKMRLDFLEEALDRFDRARGVAFWCTEDGAFLPIGGVATGSVAVRVSPYIAFALIGAAAVHLMTTAAKTPDEIAREWGNVVGAMDSIGRLVETMEASPELPPMDDCQVHLGECLGSRLQSRRGGLSGRSVCLDCEDKCRGQGTWPARTRYGKDCAWWNYK